MSEVGLLGIIYNDFFTGQWSQRNCGNIRSDASNSVKYKIIPRGSGFWEESSEVPGRYLK